MIYKASAPFSYKTQPIYVKVDSKTSNDIKKLIATYVAQQALQCIDVEAKEYHEKIDKNARFITNLCVYMGAKHQYDFINYHEGREAHKNGLITDKQLKALLVTLIKNIL